MQTALTRRPTLEISDDPLNRGLVYRFLATQQHLKDHRWYALNQSNRRVKDSSPELAGHAYTAGSPYSSVEFNPLVPDGVSAPFGSADSTYGAVTDVNSWRINNGATIEHGVGTGDFAVVVTIKPHTIASAFYGIWGNDSFAPAVYQCTTSGGGVWGMFWGPVISANSVLTVDRWHHLVVSRRAGTIYFYLDGSPDGSAANTTSMSNAGQSLGSNAVSGSNFFRGRIGEVAFYNRGLSESEAKELHDDWRRGYQRILRWQPIARPKATAGGASNAVGTSAGIATATATASSLAASVGSSDGIGTATGVGSSTAASVGSSDGVATAIAVGAAAFASVGSSAGVGTATAVGAATTNSVGSSDGAATATAVGASLAASVGSSAGVATATGVATGGASAVGSSDGVATATAVGASLAASVGTSAGSATATAVTAGGASAVGTSAGSATATAVGTSTAVSVGSSDGAATATATASALFSSIGTSAGTSTASAIADLVGAAIGSANAFATANAVGASVWRAVGTSAGIATVTGVSPVTTAGFIRVQSAYISVPSATGTLSVPRATGTIRT